MSGTGHGFPEGSQVLSPLALFLLLPPQAAKENGSLSVSITLATGYVIPMHGTHPAVGTWRVDITSATVALPFASLGVCPSTPVECRSFSLLLGHAWLSQSERSALLPVGTAVTAGSL